MEAGELSAMLSLPSLVGKNLSEALAVPIPSSLWN